MYSASQTIQICQTLSPPYDMSTVILITIKAHKLKKTFSFTERPHYNTIYYKEPFD